ncbi:unnamed protein product [Oppiella nova]|uniref:Urocanate hydratase n=1 Tax=Oppiella nova TaxID=334625 RepID=A0A7R9Q901_9ACAR|nr:unnamed protein product [Oppiella nova]CAG2158879.1 unnamed protein product [Oppiella nova]
MKYLSDMETDQTLVMNSGHPLGMYPSFKSSPRLIISNGMVIPNYSKREDYDRIVDVRGLLTAVNDDIARRPVSSAVLYLRPAFINVCLLNSPQQKQTSGLGGMSGAQAKAATIAGCISVIAEVCEEALLKRQAQGWLNEIISDLDLLIDRIRVAKTDKIVTSIGYFGNIVDLWERLVVEYDKTQQVLVELGSDQTSCHNPFNGGYYPSGLTVKEAQNMMKSDANKFKQLCQQSLVRQINAINRLSQTGLYFWDYGNAFLLEASSSCDPKDLDITDNIALNVLKQLVERDGIPKEVKDNYMDNIKWISEAKEHKLVVGSQARILYSDQIGRVSIGLAFNEAIKNKTIKSPIILSRDHHDVSGADSPFRETSNIYDGSAFTADMAVSTVIGNSGRGCTWVALHNGGGVGLGEVINCGFGLVLDGSQESHDKVVNILGWDVLTLFIHYLPHSAASTRPLVNRKQTIQDIMLHNSKVRVTLPNEVDDNVVNHL